MSWEVERKINVGSVMTLTLVIISFITGFAYLQKDVATVQAEQKRIEKFRKDVRSNYITRDQLNYMVIDRLNRLETNIDTKLTRLEELIEEQD